MIAMKMTAPPQNELNGGAGGGSSQAPEAPASSLGNDGAGESSGVDTTLSTLSEGHPTRRNSLPGGFSGLSALIQAATSQLGHLVDEEEEGDGINGAVGEIREGATRRHSWQPSPPQRTAHLYRVPSRGETTTTQQLRLKDLGGSKSTAGVAVPTSPSRSHEDAASTTKARTRHARFEDSAGQPVVTPRIVPEPDPNKQSFPEILMVLSLNPKNVDIITFLPDGKFFAMRSREFADTIMPKYFAVASFAEFLELATDWGFSRILSNQETLAPRDIEVFRHPLFVRANWALCSQIKFGETPDHARVSALPEMSRIVSASTPTGIGGDDSTAPQTPTTAATAATAAHPATPNDSCPSGTNTKRRLSPGFLHRRESESSISSQKLRMRSPGGNSGDADESDGRRESVDSESEVERLPSPTTAKVDELRSIALSITTEKLKLKSDSSVLEDPNNNSVAASTTNSDTAYDPHHRQGKGKLVDRAVESATHTIVTDAIETLLRDENHTKKTYLKHERELSVSSIPGVVPISKQLFSPDAAIAPHATQRSVSCDETATAHNGHAAAAASSSAASPRAAPEPAEITPPLQPKSSRQNGVPETPLDGPTRTDPSFPNATPPSG
jgi:HSF-type DNA-binding